MTTTYVKNNPGGVTPYLEGRTISTSAGAGDADKIPSTNTSGVLDLTITNGKVGNSGTGDANKLVARGSDGKIDPSDMPLGVTPEVLNVVASEALASGAAVQLWNSSGVLKVRNADASNGKPADGFVPAAVSSGGTAAVYFEGMNAALSGRTFGAVQYLSATTPGAWTETEPTGAGNLKQILGKATSATAATFEPRDALTLS